MNRVATLQQDPSSLGELPTTGGMRPGPIRRLPAGAASVWQGSRPVAIRIPTIQVDTDVEMAKILNGVMQDPSGPWIVAWYRGTSRLGVPGNAVFSGHVDYAGVGPAVFARLAELQPDDGIEITGNDVRIYRYRVIWARLYDAATAPVAEIAGPTSTECATLITCGGTFNAESGQYDQRYVVRAERRL